MPVCEGCGSSFADNFQFCPYCGRSAPKSPELIITVRDSSNMACPVCHSASEAKKVTAIIIHDTREVKGVTPVSSTYTDSEGKVQSRTSYEEFTSTEMSTLAKSLQGPGRPSIPGKPLDSPILYLILGVVAAVIATVFAVVTIDPFAIVLPFFCLLGGFIGWLIGKDQKASYPARLAAAEKKLAAWHRAHENWENLYYCDRDGCVFLPGQNSSAPLNKMMEFIYSH